MKEKAKKKRTRSTKRKNFEIRFYEDILKERPDCVNVLVPLGDAYTRKGFYKEGLDVDKKLAKLKPSDPTIHYNFACSLSLMGKLQEALKELKKAVLFGYDEFTYINEDADLDNLKQLPEFKIFFAKLQRLKDKSI